MDAGATMPTLLISTLTGYFAAISAKSFFRGRAVGKVDSPRIRAQERLGLGFNDIKHDNAIAVVAQTLRNPASDVLCASRYNRASFRHFGRLAFILEKWGRGRCRPASLSP